MDGLANLSSGKETLAVGLFQYREKLPETGAFLLYYNFFVEDFNAFGYPPEEITLSGGLMN